MTWLSWDYMFGKLELRMANKCADGEIDEEEYEDYANMLQNLDLAEMQEEYEEQIGFGDFEPDEDFP